MVMDQFRVLLLSEGGARIPKLSRVLLTKLLLSNTRHRHDNQMLRIDRAVLLMCVPSPMGAPVLALLAGELSTLALFSEKEAVLLDAGVWRNNTRKTG